MAEQAHDLVVEQLSQALNINATLARLLVQRGITTFDEARDFFRPGYHLLHNPYLMHGMSEAIDRLLLAFERKEKILVYGDYDVDGTTAVALVTSYIKELAPATEYYIPDRYQEGYGVSRKGMDYAHFHGFQLIITLDCGIKAVEQLGYAQSLGIDAIVCDHHLPGDELPPAVAILDPKQSKCDYPYTELCGCGIGFKLLQALHHRLDRPFEELESYLDLVAIAVACDIVPITGENRVLVSAGLKRINEKPRPGIEALLDPTRKKLALSVSDLVFRIGPRINAAGRMDHGSKAVELLLSQPGDRVDLSGQHIHEQNAFRREVDQEITEHAWEMVEAQENWEQRFSTVLFHPEWHKGVIGIVASRLIERHYRPTILLTASNGMATGSARSVRGFNVYDALEACSDLLDRFGGHKYAAGLTLPVENVPAFQERFEAVVAQTLPEELLIPELAIDTALDFSDINPKFYRILKQFAPFGPGNLSPVFLAKGVKDTGRSRRVGSDDSHLKLEVEQNGMVMQGIAFSMGDREPEIARREPFDLAFALDENEWMGEVSLQLKVKDLRFTI